MTDEIDVTVYSEPNFAGASAVVPDDGKVYALSGLKLDKVASVRLREPWVDDLGHTQTISYDLVVWQDRPEDSTPDQDEIDEGRTTIFSASTPDTGDWAQKGAYFRARTRSSISLNTSDEPLFSEYTPHVTIVE